MLRRLLPGLLSAIFVLSVAANCGSGEGIQIIKEGKDKLNVLVDGQFFTSYQFSPTLGKPVFFPLNTPRGHLLVRGYPFIRDIKGENADHKHHQSLWFTFGDVNGVDFWSEPRDSSRNGQIVHREFSKVQCGRNAGLIESRSDWIMPDGQTVALVQHQAVTIRGGDDFRTMDFDITLTAVEDTVVFGDTKEGMFGIRVTPSLKDDNAGEYLNSNGQKGTDECWGQRAKWVSLQGPVKDEQIALVIMDHPSSLNHPCYWHARGYGLLSANPFGQHAYTRGKEPVLDYILPPGESLTFKYRLLIRSGTMTKEEVEAAYGRFERGDK